MKEEILDRRVRKTRRQLKECLTRLLKEKKIQDITVRELAEMADINRGTFYLHYKDVFDLMDQIKNELIEEVESVLTHHPVPELVARPSLALSELFPLVQENAEIVSILIGENGDLNFVNRLKRIVSDKCLKGWLDLKCSSDPDTLAAFSAFIVSGCVEYRSVLDRKRHEGIHRTDGNLDRGLYLKRHPGAGKSGLTFTKFRALIKLQFLKIQKGEPHGQL